MVENEHRLEHDAQGERGRYWQEGKDIWLRARTNALAHRIAAERLEWFVIGQSVVVSLLIVIPIVAVAISFQYLSTAPAGKLPFNISHTILMLTAIISNGLVLFASMVSKDMKFSERAAQHRTLSASYAIIAQKARRLGSRELDSEAATYLYQHLQETFEIYKANSFEPADWAFTKAQKILPKLQPLPFGTDGEEESATPPTPR